MERCFNKIRIICNGDPITVFYNRVRHEGFGKYQYLIDDVKVAESTSLINGEYLKSDDLGEEKETIGQKYLSGKISLKQLFFQDVTDFENLMYRLCVLFCLPLAIVALSTICILIIVGILSIPIN